MKVRQLFCDMFSDTAGDHNFVKLWFHLRESYDFADGESYDMIARQISAVEDSS